MDIKVSTLGPTPSDPGSHTLVVRYTDVLSMVPKYILQTVVDRIVDKFVELHYAEIERAIDPKLVAAIVALQVGGAIEEKMLEEIKRVRLLADEALRISKRR